MPAEKHPAYGEEIERLRFTLGYVEESIGSMTGRKSRLDEEVSRGKRHFNSESSQQYIELMINSMLQERAELKLRNLLTARSRPYFARIDFLEAEKESAEKLYIGKMALIREEDQELIIVDWRAPVANLYYEGRLGDAHYWSPEGDIAGQLLLKRQFSIDTGRLEEMFDIDITTNDEFLQASLGANADNRLKEIVSTIQVEQNRVIRADMWKPLIVQGAAGSGKTTIALHRIAYLIYLFEKTFKPENFMIIAPTKFFLNYISEVLPELGVEKTKQTTFEEFAVSLIGEKFKIKDANEKLSIFVNRNNTEAQQKRNLLLHKESRLKCSMVFKEVIDDYIGTIEEKFIPQEDFKLFSRVVLPYDEINRLFLIEYRKLPIVKRIDEIRKHLNNRLKAYEASVIQEIQSRCDKYIINVKQHMEESEERREMIVKAIDKKNEAVGQVREGAKKAVKSYIAKISRLNPLEYYKDMVYDELLFNRLFEGRAEPEVLRFARSYSEEVLRSGYVEIEDIAPIMYLKFKIHGVDEKIPVKHIVIDEAQDFSVFQLYVLKNIIKDSSFTILGDLSQGIHGYRGIQDWKDVSRHVFGGQCEELVLEQSYRTTVEIMDAANQVIAKLRDPRLIPAKPVIRHGSPVEIIGMDNRDEIVKDIARKLKQMKQEGLKSMAVICKTSEECIDIHERFKKAKGELPHVITEKDKEYKSGMVIVPSHLAKGLEFDAVFVANADEDSYKLDELDVKLLYVAMTRPLHYLRIYYSGNLTPLLR